MSSRIKYEGDPDPTLAKNRPPNKVISPETWLNLDWNETDSLLAEKLGVTRSRIAQVRALLCAPKSPFKGAHRDYRKMAKGESKMAYMNWDLPNAILATVWGVFSSTTAMARARYANGHKPKWATRYEAFLLDAEYLDAVLEEIDKVIKINKGIKKIKTTGTSPDDMPIPTFTGVND